MNEKTLVFGGAHIDKEYTLYGKFIPETSNPCWSRVFPGGVGLNIASHLKRLGSKYISLVSAIGEDETGTRVIETCDYFGIDTRFISVFKQGLTAEYACGISADKHLLFGLANMDIYENIDFEILKPFLSQYHTYPFWVIETNFPKTTLEKLLKAKRDQMVFVVVTSSVKVLRLKEVLGYIDHLILNESEFNQLLGRKCIEPEEYLKGLREIHKKGVKCIYLTRDERGTVVSTGSTVETYLKRARSIRRTSGAGDAFAANFIYNYIKSENINKSATLAAGYACDLVEGSIDLYEGLSLGRSVA